MGSARGAFFAEACISLPSKYASCLDVKDSVIACSNGKRICLLSRESLEVTRELKGHKVNVEELCFFQHAPMLASCGADNTAKIWDVRQEKCTSTYALAGEPTCISVGSDGNLVALGIEDKVELWDVRMGKQHFVFTEVHSDVVNCVQFHPFHRHMLISASEDNLVCQLDTKMLDEDEGVPWVVNNEDNVRTVKVIGQARHYAVVTASTTDVIRVWSDTCENLGEFSDVRHSPPLQVEESCGYVVNVFNGDDRAYVLGGSSEGTLRLFHLNLEGLELAHSFVVPDSKEGHRGVVRSALMLDTDVVLAGDEHGKLIAWRQRDELLDSAAKRIKCS